MLFLWENARKRKKYDILTRQWAMFDPTDTHSYHHRFIVKSIKESYFENNFNKIPILKGNTEKNDCVKG